MAQLDFSPTEWERAGHCFNWNGHRIFYMDSATTTAPGLVQPNSDTRPVLVLVHGFPTSSWDWQAIWRPLSQSFRLVAMDLLGFGFSDKPAGFDYRLEGQADVVDALMAHLNIGAAYAVVHDYGVSIGQELLHRQRHQPGRIWRVQGMIFLNGGLFPETHRPRFIQRLLASPIGWLVAQLGSEARFRASFSAVFGAGTQPSESELQAFWQLIARQNGHRIFHRLIRYMDDRKRRSEDWRAALRNSDVPIRLINGPDDPVSGAHMVARYREVVGAVDCVSLPGIGHYPHCEAPHAVVQAILDWPFLRMAATSSVAV